MYPVSPQIWYGPPTNAGAAYLSTCHLPHNQATGSVERNICFEALEAGRQVGRVYVEDSSKPACGCSDWSLKPPSTGCVTPFGRRRTLSPSLLLRSYDPRPHRKISLRPEHKKKSREKKSPPLFPPPTIKFHSAFSPSTIKFDSAFSRASTF